MLSRLYQSARAVIRRSLGYTEQLLQARLPGIPNTMSSIAVNEQTALRYAAVYACVRCIAETKGSLPYEVIQVSKGGTEKVTRFHPIANLLAYEPHADMTPMIWAETRQQDILTGGNSYTELTTDNDGIVIAATPRHWSLVRPYRNDANELMYEVRSALGGPVRHLDRSQMCHVPGFGNGIVGWSPIRLHAETIGIGLAQDKYSAAFFGNAAKPSLVVTTPQVLQENHFKRTKDDLEQGYTRDNAHRVLLLDGGLTAAPLMLPAAEAQLCDAQYMTEERIARIYRVPAHKIGLLRGSNYNTIEAEDLNFEKHTMRPWIIRDEQEINRKMFLKSERGKFYVRVNVDDLLRADIKTRYDAYKTAILCGILTQNECRAKERLTPMPGGDELLKPESIFGKSGGSPDLQSTDGQSAKDAKDPAKRIDPRLEAITEQTLIGLLNREITHAERAAARPDEFRATITAQYERHREVFAEKLKPLGDPAPVLRNLERHRDQLLALSTSQILPDELRETLTGWNAEITTLAADLIGS